MINTTSNPIEILTALDFAADKHRRQRRKDVDASPYINHPIEVAKLLSAAGVNDIETLQAAILHDTIEDTETSAEELEENFGHKVRHLVEEVSDDKTLSKEVRKSLQIEHAPQLPDEAKQIKIADLTSNILGITIKPPAGWSVERKRDYLDWATQVVLGCRGVNKELENKFDEAVENARKVLDGLSQNSGKATLEDAISIAALAHKGQFDKAGNPYILHPLRMMMRMKSAEAMMAAVLHDVVEDTKWTLDQLRERGFSEEVLAAVDCLTHRTGESYEEFIERVQKNPIAHQVKIADLEDNMNIQRIGEIKPRDLERLERYHKSWSVLTKA